MPDGSELGAWGWDGADRCDWIDFGKGLLASGKDDTVVKEIRDKVLGAVPRFVRDIVDTAQRKGTCDSAKMVLPAKAFPNPEAKLLAQRALELFGYESFWKDCLSTVPVN